jgi:hypothetical protein
MLFSLTVGCGDGRPRCVPVSGKVLIDGKSLTQGYIRLIPAKTRPAIGNIDAQGRFTLTTFERGDGCVPGTHRVELSAFEPIDESHIRWLVPQKCRRSSTSGLSVAIDGPTDSLVIELSWDGEKPLVEQWENEDEE